MEIKQKIAEFAGISNQLKDFDYFSVSFPFGTRVERLHTSADSSSLARRALRLIRCKFRR
jgi:hypothetical protein